MSKRISALASLLALLTGEVALADDLDRASPFRDEVNSFIDVLSVSGATPSQGCLTALDEMHTTDHQLKTLTGQLDEGGEAPQALEGERGEIGIARDVLASDLQTAAAACKVDAERTCAAATGAKLLKACESARRDIETERPAKH